MSFGEEGQLDMKSVEAEANATPIIRYVDLILYQAIQDRASDIHFEPFETEFKIRYRVDGALYEMAPPPRHLALPVISRVKVMSNLNIAERRLPQDGRIQKNIAGRPVDLRVSTLPTQFGESVVLRVLDRSTVNLNIEALGMPDYIYNYILRTHREAERHFHRHRPDRLGQDDHALRLPEQDQHHRLEGADRGGPGGIRHRGHHPGADERRHRPDVRARAARLPAPGSRPHHGRRNARPGDGADRHPGVAHRAIWCSPRCTPTTPPGAVTRLIDMGVEPFMISASLEGVLGQRLIRKICTNCRTAYEPTETVLAQLGLSPHEIGDKNFYYGKGCDACNHTGYKGRKGIYELLDITDPIRELINERAPTVVLKQKAIELGMTTLREDGLRWIYDGETTIEEVLKYT